MIRFALVAFLATAAACAPQPASTPAGASGPDGIVRHYIRSNRDGSEPEHIVHFRPTRTDVAVYKWMSKCETAAYVTAQMDPTRWEPTGLDAGKVAKDGSQATFGRIDLDPATRTVSAWADLPPGRMTDTTTVPGDMPWFLFDYDLGDLNAYLQERRPTGDFEFAWALIWPGSEDFLTAMSTVHAAHRGLEDRGGRSVRRFDLHLTGGKTGEGQLFTDPATGAIVEAQVSLPNHPEYRDFKLLLEREEVGGQAAWDALLRAHYATCPA